jgi:hypothetical protein
MAFHADRREARSSSHEERAASSTQTGKQSDTRGRRADRLRHGNGRYDVPTLERIHATVPAALWAGHVFQPEALIVPEITSIVRRPLTGRRRGSR